MHGGVPKQESGQIEPDARVNVMIHGISAEKADPFTSFRRAATAGFRANHDVAVTESGVCHFAPRAQCE
jgi:hypothetical protein